MKKKNQTKLIPIFFFITKQIWSLFSNGSATQIVVGKQLPLRLL